MRLIVTMYHRASAGRHGNDPAMLDDHFAMIAARYRCVLPGEDLADDLLNVCLSFDDGYFDFYSVVFPLLVKHDLRAMVAVPVSLVHESVRNPASARLASCRDRTPQGATDPDGYCTWNELAEMVGSGRVTVAAHGLTHCRLDRSDVDLDAEISVPRTLLSARLGRPVDSFVLPFGRFDGRVLSRARAEYRYVFRIGGADNVGWGGPLLYRVDADAMESPDALYRPRRRITYALRRRWNALRGR